MNNPTADRTGILMVRLWIEKDAVSGLGARITQTMDTKEPEHLVSNAADSAEICAVIQNWVERFVASN